MNRGFNNSVVWIVLCILTFTFATEAHFAIAQESAATPDAATELRGLVVSATKYSFQMKSDDGKVTDVITNDATAFALRMSRPWFDGDNNRVAVDGKPLPEGGFERLQFQLPAKPLYVLARFRTVAQRDRLIKKTPWLLNSYLLTQNPIDPLMPTGKSLLIAGKLDLKKSELDIDRRIIPIHLGHKGATLLDRSIADLIPGQSTVLVTGTLTESKFTADTVLFRMGTSGQ